MSKYTNHLVSCLNRAINDADKLYEQYLNEDNDEMIQKYNVKNTREKNRALKFKKDIFSKNER